MNNKFVKMLLVALFTCMCSVSAFADVQSDTEDSKTLALQINLAKQEIKTLKARMKLEPTNTVLSQQMTEQNEKLAKLKSDKKIVDANIKAQKAAIKAEKAALKAKQKAEKAVEKAEKAAAQRASIKQ